MFPCANDNEAKLQSLEFRQLKSKMLHNIKKPLNRGFFIL